jgi:hypothetical protein
MPTCARARLEVHPTTIHKSMASEKVIAIEQTLRNST